MNLNFDGHRRRVPTVEYGTGVPLRLQRVLAHWGRDLLTFTADDAVRVRFCVRDMFLTINLHYTHIA